MLEFLRGQVKPTYDRHPDRELLFIRISTLFLVIAPFVGVIWAIVHFWNNGIGVKDAGILAGFYIATAFGVTVGFHRMLTHRSFDANPVVKAILLIFGTWSIQGAAIGWAAIHAKHHTKSDGEGDPHSPYWNESGKAGVWRGFFHAHMGWMLGGIRADPERYAKAQMQDPVIRFISKTAFWWAVLGMLLPFFIGGVSGFIWGGLVRVFLVHHVTWSVNSVCHIWGKRDFSTGKDRSTNNWIVGLLSMGEGWHNNHHAFPRSAYHGLTWLQIDFSAWFIRGLRALRLVSNVYEVPKQVISARKSQEQQRRAA